ncbi:MAG: ATP-binding protein, partial [Thermodesulfovibrionales bacterium]|nr:ATP-binding protein [Thermodesulfovibrionales bacterium]
LPLNDNKRLYTENMLKEIDRLNHLVEDILNFAQNPTSSVEPTDISQVLSQCISLARYNFPEKDVEVKEAHQPGLPLILADQERLTQAFLNLLINAFEASPPGGRIGVKSKGSEARSQKSEVRNLIVTISDSGPGITPEDLPRIFDPFYTTKEKGTGLGLSIAQNIITAYGGSIEAESVPGQGATFRVILPVEGGTEG